MIPKVSIAIALVSLLITASFMTPTVTLAAKVEKAELPGYVQPKQPVSKQAEDQQNQDGTENTESQEDSSDSGFYPDPPGGSADPGDPEDPPGDGSGEIALPIPPPDPRVVKDPPR